MSAVKSELTPATSGPVNSFPRRVCGFSLRPPLWPTAQTCRPVNQVMESLCIIQLRRRAQVTGLTGSAESLSVSTHGLRVHVPVWQAGGVTVSLAAGWESSRALSPLGKCCGSLRNLEKLSVIFTFTKPLKHKEYIYSLLTVLTFGFRVWVHGTTPLKTYSNCAKSH